MKDKSKVELNSEMEDNLSNKTNYKNSGSLSNPEPKKKQDELDLVLKGYKNLLKT